MRQENHMRHGQEDVLRAMSYMTVSISTKSPSFAQFDTALVRHSSLATQDNKTGLGQAHIIRMRQSRKRAAPHGIA